MSLQRQPSLATRICRLGAIPIRAADGGARLDRPRELGFDAVLLTPIFAPHEAGEVLLGDGHEDAGSAGQEAFSALRAFSAEAERRSLALYMDLALHRAPATHPLAKSHPWAFSSPGEGEAAADPRLPPSRADELRARLDQPKSADLLGAFAVEALGRWARAGVRGIRVLEPHLAPAAFWRELIGGLRGQGVEFAFIADARAAPRDAVVALAGCGFDALTSSLAWWDGRARWFVEEHQALRRTAPVVADMESPSGSVASPIGAGPLALAAATGAAMLIPIGLDDATPALDEAVRQANGLRRRLARFDGELRMLSGEGAAVTALLHADAPDVRRCTEALIVLLNPNAGAQAEAAPDVLVQAGAAFEPFTRLDGDGAPFAPLAPAEVRLLVSRRSDPITHSPQADAGAARAAALAPRLVVEGMSPVVEGGPFPVRRVVGEAVQVGADIFGDGHEQLAAELRWRPLDQPHWRTVPMTVLGNDRWAADFPLERLGRHAFAIEAWLDAFGGFQRDFGKKRAAGVAQAVDAQEGCELVRSAEARTSGELRGELKAALARLEAAGAPAQGELLLDPALGALMRTADDRPFRLRSPVQFVDAERLQARYASWYELFPRSQTDRAERHGTFEDVIARLPAVRAMGFDVLYFPPIHPIGRKNRKGRNNSLTPGPDDPGSPYAIGSDEGGHEAIHAELGTLEDFRRLVAAAADQGLEIALDFAIQCSPDHPWLKQHPGWFDWRPDGSIKYAENPPKKYQDIVNVDFYKPEALPDLWLALRDIVLLWVGEGVRLFRVDNPHTKPLPFWEWMIGEVRAAHPDVVFLAEAFTRPKLMYRLAKIGFSQSYTYFTWRHTKQEFIDYLTELTTTAPKEFYRPHFFVNTPDINPPFLQSSGRSGFLIRAALAATLSGLWGVYSGFELLEADPVPGKEEYKDSEKYEIKPRDWSAPGNIVAEITRLNRIRKGHPALQTHLGVVFLPAWNDKVLVFAKATAGLDDVVVAAISLDPHTAQETSFELPLWSWGLGDAASVQVEDLIWEQRFAWTGKTQSVRLDPAQPYAIWSVRIPQKAVS